jgi:hypothetical protein
MPPQGLKALQALSHSIGTLIVESHPIYDSLVLWEPPAARLLIALRWKRRYRANFSEAQTRQGTQAVKRHKQTVFVKASCYTHRTVEAETTTK